MHLHPPNSSRDHAVGRCRLLLVLCVGSLVLLSPWTRGGAEESVDPAYLKVVTERAAKIVDGLGVDDADQRERVTELVAQQYVALSRIHDGRDAAIEAARNGDEGQREAAVALARSDADAKIYRLHAAFVAGLSVELTPDQVDGVKDGMTYGVAQGTYDVYMKMCPDLSSEQKRRIRAWLLEARELAMDQGSSKEKHGVFGKYKGKINNYLSAAGIDLKEAEKNLFK